MPSHRTFQKKIHSVWASLTIQSHPAVHRRNPSLQEGRIVHLQRSEISRTSGQFRPRTSLQDVKPVQKNRNKNQSHHRRRKGRRDSIPRSHLGARTSRQRVNLLQLGLLNSLQEVPHASPQRLDRISTPQSQFLSSLLDQLGRREEAQLKCLRNHPQR